MANDDLHHGQVVIRRRKYDISGSWNCSGYRKSISQNLIKKNLLDFGSMSEVGKKKEETKRVRKCPFCIKCE
jgi:hypothetical protein